MKREDVVICDLKDIFEWVVCENNVVFINRKEANKKEKNGG